MMNENEIAITINGKTHRFSAGDVDALKALPWNERKQLIDLLEDIKQAEYVNKTANSEESESVVAGSKNIEPASQQSEARPAQVDMAQKQPNKNPAETNFDPQVKTSTQDVNDLMQRLILEEKQHHKSIPDKSSVVKLLLGVIVLILVLAAMF